MIVYLGIYLILINIIAFAFYGMDKRRAKRGEWRISEGMLLFLGAIGGSVGAYAGMKIFHHKTRKPLFRFGIPFLFGFHLMILYFL